jgi:hypothetical protein
MLELLPLFMLYPAVMQAGAIEERLQRLEEAVLLSLDSLRVIACALQARLGAGALGPEVGRIAAIANDAESLAAVERIDSAIKRGDKAGATRLLREEFGCTWDQAHQALHGWGSHSKDLRCRCVRLARYVKALRTPGMPSDSVPHVLVGSAEPTDAMDSRQRLA